MNDPSFHQVDEALRTYPLKPTPATLAPRMAARLRALAPAPRFQLMWTDYALSLFAAGMLGLALLAWQVVTPQTLVRFQFHALRIVQQVGVVGVGALLGGLVLAIGACGLAALILARPFESPWRIRA